MPQAEALRHHIQGPGSIQNWMYSVQPTHSNTGTRISCWDSKEFLNGNILSASTVEKVSGMRFEQYIIEGCQIESFDIFLLVFKARVIESALKMNFKLSNYLYIYQCRLNPGTIAKLSIELD